MSDSDDDLPLARGAVNGASSRSSLPSLQKKAKEVNGTANHSHRTSNGVVESNGKRKSRPLSMNHKDSDDDPDDEPLIKRRRISAQKQQIKPDPEIDEDSDTPLAAKSPKNAASKAKTQDKKRVLPSKVKKQESDDEIPLSKTATARSKIKASKAEPPVKGRAKAAAKEAEAEEDAAIEEEEEEQFKWWEAAAAKGDGSKKWDTLEHNGVVFPPAYEPLPKNVMLEYDGRPVRLHPEAEEVAAFYGTMLHSTVNVENPTFNKNFFDDFKGYVEKSGHATDAQTGEKIKIKSFEKCNFRPIFNYFEADRAAKKALSAAEKKAIKATKDENERPYQYCLWDGRKQKVGNFRVEPPGLFRGRGEHPKTGRVKTRVMPEQITINIGKNATVPPPPEGHQWKEVKHDNTGTWLAMWQENINGNYKYVMLAASSDVKGQSDFKKFEKARELKKHVDRIRRDYRKALKDDQMATRQLATAVYLIDQFALRAGNEKGDDEADTVGCCSLKYEHVTLKPPNTVVFDFLGKDSIRFHEEFEVDPQVFKNLKIFKKAPKTDGDEIFDRLTTSALNKHLSSYMQGLTAKVFRTFNASKTMSDLLQSLKVSGTIPEKIKAYNEANKQVAILCNHKRTVAAGHAGQMEKLQDRLKALQYQQWRLKQMILDVDPKQKKKKPAGYFDLTEGIDKEWVKKHHEDLVEEHKEKIKKKFAKDNEKLVADGQKEMKAKELQERLESARDLGEKFKRERKTGKIEAEGKSASVERYETQIEKLDQRFKNMEVQAEDKESNKEVALGTSKINYIDPRLSVVFSKKFDVPIERLFSKTLREKFQWAIESVDENWTF